jgi:menaquinone-dependent protoporphyrinogen oxidase
VTKKILVAYASKCGSTGEVAEAMRKALCETGASVDVRLAKAVRDVSGYQGVIVGSAIRLGQWLPEALQFIKRHQAALSRVPVAYFSVGSFLRDGTAKSRQDAAASQNAARALVAPVSTGLFAGKIDMSKLSLVDRLLIKAVQSPEGDWRDWDAIRAWALQALPAS